MVSFDKLAPGSRYDIIVIGCGVGGYNTALRGIQLGLSVACIEQAPLPGGTGVHTGCIPSRVLLHASELYHQVKAGKGAQFGIDGTASLDLNRMMDRKQQIVGRMANDVKALLRRHGITTIFGKARLAGPGRVVVRDAAGIDQILTGSHVVVATGSESVPFPGLEFDGDRVLDSAAALRLDRVPGHLVVIGAGAAGVEIGSIWMRLGASVTLIERQDRICPWLDRGVSMALAGELRRQGMRLLLGAEATCIEMRPGGVSIGLSSLESRGIRSVEAERVLVAIGRRPTTGDLNLESAGIETNTLGEFPRRGFGPIVPGVWVVGDAASGGPMLVSKAEAEAIACAEQIAGLPGFVDYASIPMVLESAPECAMIGLGEESLQAAGSDYRVGLFAMSGSVRARTHGVGEGFVKILVDARTQLIVGAQILGVGAAAMISEVAIAMDASTICEDFARACRPHPFWSECLRQAARAAGGWMTHG